MATLVVNYRGHQYLRAGVTKLAAAVNLAVYDPTHEVEAQKWVGDQLRKKRRVWRDLAEQMDFVLFSSDIPDAQKAIYAIRQKFDKMFETPVKLVEIVDPEQLLVRHEADRGPAAKPAAPPAASPPAPTPGADAARQAAMSPFPWESQSRPVKTSLPPPVEAYIRKIKNVAKQKYARDYATWIVSGQKGPGPHPSLTELGMMGQQAVRWALRDLGVKEKD
jgi:hypothetical protein